MALEKILFVDDEPDIRMLVDMTLKRLGGFQVRTEASGRAALAALNEGYQPDMVLLDVMMPEMDGVQTLQAIRRLPGLDALPICFLTAKVQPTEVARWQAMGVSGILSKPFSPATLIGQLQETWRLWRSSRMS